MEEGGELLSSFSHDEAMIAAVGASYAFCQSRISKCRVNK